MRRWNRTGAGSSAARLPETGALEPVTCGVGTGGVPVPTLMTDHDAERRLETAREWIKFPPRFWKAVHAYIDNKKFVMPLSPKRENQNFLFFFSFGGYRFYILLFNILI